MLHLRDERIQTVHLGVSPQEIGVVVAEAQRLLDESRTRALHLEGVAQEIQDRACEQIQKLKSMVESLYQACQSKDLTIHGLSNDLGALQDEVALVQSQLQSQISKCTKYETILGHKDSEIQRLMTELGVAKQSLDSSLEMREQLQGSLAASSSLSARLDGMSNRVDAVLSQFIYMAEMEQVSRLPPQVGYQFQPKDFPTSLLGVILVMMVREKMMMKKN